jgi:ABC-type multidrug transport system fused ATPase/permease subunit
VKLVAFGISALIAGLAGGLYAYNFGSVSADRFDALTALSLIAFAYAGGITLISGAVFAGLISTQALLPYALDKWLGINGNWFLLFGGAILIVTLIQNPDGVAGAFYRRTHKRPALRPPRADVAVGDAPAPRPPHPVGTSEPPLGTGGIRVGTSETPVLTVGGLSVTFGGVRALDGVDLEVREGELVGLIGPNGAGKTTFVDTITGFVGFSGNVKLDGRDIGRLPPYDRARLGLARTWQSTDLFDDLDVRENLTVASTRNAGSESAAVSADGKVDSDDTLRLPRPSWNFGDDGPRMMVTQ